MVECAPGRGLPIAVAASALSLLAACSSRVPPHDPNRIAAGFSLYDVPVIASSKDLSGTMWIEWRGSPRPAKLPLVRPVVGIDLDSHRDVFAYAGVCADLPLGGGFHLVPGFAPGWWIQGDEGSKDLGSAVEFRSSLELAYQLSDDVQVGVAFQHQSNANLSSVNPGADSVVLTVSIPLGARSRRRNEPAR